jgi:hypothetical protein
MTCGAPIIIVEPLQVDLFVRRSVLFPKQTTGDPLNLHAHFGYRRNISTNTGSSVSVYSEQKGHTSVGLVSRSGYHSSVILSSGFPQTTLGDTSHLYHLAK